jgi:hypothetical protein
MMRQISCTCSIGLPSRPECSLNRGLLPAAACLEPEDGGDDRFTTFARCLAEEVLRQLGVGLGVAKGQFVCLRIDTQHPGNVRLRNT